MSGPELLSPAGDMESALAAFDAGADAVYCGLDAFSARAFAKNFTLESLDALMRVADSRGKKVYVAFNTLVSEAGMPDAVRRLAALDSIRPSGLIVQDLGVAEICRRNFPSLPLHASTQLFVHNLEGVSALGALGFKRVVLARELSLEEISYITKRCGDVEIECFVHGALCYSISGLCLYSSMEKARSGNRGLCAYCCRQSVPAPDGSEVYPFSMKDLRLGRDAVRLAAAGVSSLKIEGRMKSPLYVASATSFYRHILDGSRGGPSAGDIETVFSRRTTELYLDGPSSPYPVDPVSVGHLGALAGTAKRVTKDREGRSWLRLHTARALEKHDGLQIVPPRGGRPAGFGISQMRNAISRSNLFETGPGEDVEILLPDAEADLWRDAVEKGAEVYCSMSNAVKRAFPPPAYRPSEYPGRIAVDVDVSIENGRIAASAKSGSIVAEASVEGSFEKAKDPGNASAAAEKAFSHTGESRISARSVSVSNPGALFVRAGELKNLRRKLMDAVLDAVAEDERRRASAALGDLDELRSLLPASSGEPRKTVKLRPGQKVPSGEWDEIILAVGASDTAESVASAAEACAGRDTRLALPVFTRDPSFQKLRILVKRLLRDGFAKWEAADVAGLSLLKASGVEDVSADWSLYACNTAAAAMLASMGAKRFVSSPESAQAERDRLFRSGLDMEFLAQQSTPLFISATKPAATEVPGLAIFGLDGLWIATKPAPRIFHVPAGASCRYDLSWSAPQ